MASQNDDFNKIKLYIQSDAGRQPLMISWNPTNPLKALIAEVCNQWNIKNPESFALKFKSANQDVYMTEENRKIKSGELLQLTSSPKIIAEELKQLLKQGTPESKERAVTLLKPIIKDLYFVTSFLAIDGVHFLIETIQQDIINIPLTEQQMTVSSHCSNGISYTYLYVTIKLAIILLSFREFLKAVCYSASSMLL